MFFVLLLVSNIITTSVGFRIFTFEMKSLAGAVTILLLTRELWCRLSSEQFVPSPVYFFLAHYSLLVLLAILGSLNYVDIMFWLRWNANEICDFWVIKCSEQVWVWWYFDRIKKPTLNTWCLPLDTQMRKILASLIWLIEDVNMSHLKF